MTKFFLVLTMFSGSSASPSMTTIPEPFASYDACKKAGEAWNKGWNRSYYCLDIDPVSLEEEIRKLNEKK